MALMDIFNSFRAAPQPGPAGQPPTQAAAITANTTIPGATTPASDGSMPAIPAAGKGDKSPLSGYADLWQASDNDARPIDWKPNIKADPVKVKAAAEALDFTSQIPAELMLTASKGDPAALARVMNLSAQGGFAKATETTAAIVNEALEKQGLKYKEEIIPAILKDFSTSQAVRADQPLYENPAAAPMLSLVENQLKIKYPTASPAEISAKAKEYVNQFAEVVVTSNGQQVTAPVKPAAHKQEQDWDKFFTMG